MSKEQIQGAIEEICQTLKGPGISNEERLLLHEDRKDLRKLLAEQELEEKAA